MNVTITALQEIISSLEQKFPTQLPTKPISLEEVHIRIGHRQVIEHLVAVLESKQ